MVLRAFVPSVAKLHAVIEGSCGAFVELNRRGEGDFFEAFLPGETSRFAYRLRAEEKRAYVGISRSPSLFGPVLGAVDDHILLGPGTHQRLYERLGAHAITHENVDGVLSPCCLRRKRSASPWW